MRKRLLLLGLLGVLMTMSVAAAAIVSLGHVSAVNRELAQLNRVQRYHQDADMMHDALRADVARAQLAGAGLPGVSPAAVRRDADRHATKFRADLRAAESLQLSPALERALGRLIPAQRTYIATAESMVASALAQRGTALAERVSYEAAFQQLVPTQERVTEQLMATSSRVERAAVAEKTKAERLIGLAALAALAGWMALVTWHHHSLGSLQTALVREAEQRSASDLLQASLLPQPLPPVPGVHLAARSVPGSSRQRVGGDWYDVLSLPTGQVCLVVGDVVGHDLPAAAAMGQLRSSLRAYALEDAEPTRLLTRLNRATYLLDVCDLATCVFAVLDPSTRKVRWSSAGHLPPLLCSTADTGRLLNTEPGPPLGVTTTADYQHHEIQLEPGDTLLLYSDGAVERRGTTIDAGLANLQTLSFPQTEPEAVCDQLLSTLLDEANHNDDLTLLLLRVDASPGKASRHATSAATFQTPRPRSAPGTSENTTTTSTA